MSTTEMMLDSDGDIAFDGMDISVGTGSEVVGQRLYMRLSVFQGEWFLNLLFGTPYYQNILGTNFSQVILNAIFLGVILGTPGVDRLRAPIEYTMNRRGRQMSMKFDVVTTSGAVLPVVYPPVAAAA